MYLKVNFLFVYLFAIVVHSEEVLECGVLKSGSKPPWTVGLYVENGEILELLCLGTIFKPNFILTAAHCLCENSSGVLRKDAIYISSQKLVKNIKISESGELQKVEKENIFLNNAYKGASETKGDLAIIKLEKDFSDVIPVCIDWDNAIQNVQDGDWLKHTTWQKGNIELTDVSCVDLDVCRKLASSSFITFITNDKICVKSQKEVSTDNIDAGGGLIYLNFIDDLWYLRGVTNFQDIADKKLITYSSVNIFLNWLSIISVKP